MAVPRINSLRIAVVQFSPKIGQVHANIAKARELCSKLKPRSIDIVCLPEMVFAGYVFQDATSISSHLEHPRSGPTSQFCAELAMRLRCFVAAGYPERLGPHEVEVGLDEGGQRVEKIGANSALVYGPNGEFVQHYRKTNLYEMDMTWAKAGSGFTAFSLPSPLKRVSLGICMDLNVQPPATWSLEDGPYEIAEHCIETKSDILILLNAWLDSGEDEDEHVDRRTLSYWAARLRPLWVGRGENHWNGRDSEQIGSEEEHKEMVVVICNRTGKENGKTFAGSSAIFNMRSNSGRPHLLHFMGRDEEGVHVWDV